MDGCLLMAGGRVYLKNGTFSFPLCSVWCGEKVMYTFVHSGYDLMQLHVQLYLLDMCFAQKPQSLKEIVTDESRSLQQHYVITISFNFQTLTGPTLKH